MVMFYNKSSINGVSAPMTRAFYRALSSIDGLTLQNGENLSADAVLIGVISSRDKLNEAIIPGQLRKAKAVAPNAVENRNDFYIPTQSNAKLKVRVFVVKRPTPDEIKLLQSELGNQVPTQGNIIFNDSFNVSKTFDHEIQDDSTKSSNLTQTRGGKKQAINAMSKDVADRFKSMVLYAF